ncbi:Protein of unknown function [Gryllus bimaculatus]|nr:Protein of unknown function [Gryllus bimaculatus]
MSVVTTWVWMGRDALTHELQPRKDRERSLILVHLKFEPVLMDK